MDVNDSLRDMLTSEPRRTEPDMPTPGSRVTDAEAGITITVDRSVRMPTGQIVAFGLDDNGQPQRANL